MKTALVLLALMVGLASGYGAAPTALSPAGKKRLRENLETLNKNLSAANTNLAAIRKNRDTVQTELVDLQKLEKEHLELRKKYTERLDSLEAETKKNDEALRVLEKATPSPEVVKEKQDREKWKTESAAKTAKLRESLLALSRNLADVQSRVAPLKEELERWAKREGEYKGLIADFESKKKELEKVAGSEQ